MRRCFIPTPRGASCCLSLSPGLCTVVVVVMVLVVVSSSSRPLLLLLLPPLLWFWSSGSKSVLDSAEAGFVSRASVLGLSPGGFAPSPSSMVEKVGLELDQEPDQEPGQEPDQEPGRPSSPIGC